MSGLPVTIRFSEITQHRDYTISSLTLDSKHENVCQVSKFHNYDASRSER